LLDGVLLVPGYDYSERAVGTTAASVALHERADVVIGGPEHYHSRLMFLSSAASLVPDPRRETTCGAVVVAGYQSVQPVLLLPLARVLAQQVADRMGDEPHRRSRVIMDRFSRYREGDGEWVLATDGDWVVSNTGARRLEPADLRSLTDLALAGLGATEFAGQHVDLPSGGCAEIATEGVYLSGELIGCVLTGGAANAGRPAGPPEAVRRQGSHVAPTARRDYAEDLRRPASMRKIHAQARIRANQDLMTPVLRARQEVAASIRQGRSHLLIGEPGVGKRTLAQAQFRQAFPQGRVVAVSCTGFESGSGHARHDPVASLLHASLQVVRVLEGYAWPGNISELVDVLRYVAARKPMLLTLRAARTRPGREPSGCRSPASRPPRSAA
jgi:transcriptional regulator of acetoin/glycerol metabolism